MNRRAFFRGAGPAVAAASLAPVAVFIAKPPLPPVTDTFQLQHGDMMSADTLNQHIDVRAQRMVTQYLAQLRRDGLI